MRDIANKRGGVRKTTILFGTAPRTDSGNDAPLSVFQDDPPEVKLTAWRWQMTRDMVVAWGGRAPILIAVALLLLHYPNVFPQRRTQVVAQTGRDAPLQTTPVQAEATSAAAKQSEKAAQP